MAKTGNLESKLSTIVIHATAIHQAEDILDSFICKNLRLVRLRVSEMVTKVLTLSPVIGQIPPLAKVPAITAMLSAFISIEQVWK